MMATLERSLLHVEGTDDFHAICHLLIRSGIDYDRRPWPAGYPEIKEVGGKDQLLDGMETAVSLSSGRSIGFVLDADSSLSVDGLRCHRDSHAREWRLQRNYRRVDSWEKHQNIVLGWERGLCRTINDGALEQFRCQKKTSRCQGTERELS